MRHSIEREWTTKAGYRAVCLSCNGYGQSHLCGYVELPKGHPLHGVEYSTDSPALKAHVEAIKNQPMGKRGILSMVCWDGEKATPEIVFNVHGSITFSELGDKKNAYPVESDGGWWYGFDCAHSGDTPETCNLEYVAGECESLAEQLASVGIPVTA